MTTIVGIDTSMTSTGLAVLVTGEAREKTSLRRIESKPPNTPRHPKTGKKLKPTLEQRSDRITDMKTRILSAVFAAAPDLAVIESPSFGSTGGDAHDRSGLWWLVVDGLAERCYPTAEVAPTSRIKYALGVGRGDKDKVLAAAIKRYPHLDVTGNDVADALLLAAMGARHLGRPIEQSLPETHISAMTGGHWPALEVTR